MPDTIQPTEQERAVAKQARSFCYQFTEGAISFSEFMYASVALYTANADLIEGLHNRPGSEHEL